MRATPFIFSVIGATLISAGMVTAHAATGVFYDPTNAASTSGKTVGHELFGTIGCPGRGLLDASCPKPKPVDSDGDGVVDGKDKCPNTPKGAKVDAKGCPIDSDGDGVYDGLDMCPNTPAGMKVNALGCEIDTDGDGVLDSVDKCPTVYARTPDGCPPVVAEPAPAPVPAPAPAAVPMVILGDVNFAFDSAVLKPSAKEKIEKAVAHVQGLPDETFELLGHTDSIGTEEYNMGLSQRRVDAVRNAMIKLGVAPERLTARGYGETKPIATNSTKEGRAANRRVELLGAKITPK